MQRYKKDILAPAYMDDDNLDKYNPNSGYYKDLCYKTTSEYKTDISLSDRKNQFVDKNMTLCEEDCDFISYNYSLEKVKCSCLVKINIFLFLYFY